MVKKITKRSINNTVGVFSAQWDWIGVKVDDPVIVQDDEGKHGRFLSIFKPTKKEDVELVADKNAATE